MFYLHITLHIYTQIIEDRDCGFFLFKEECNEENGRHAKTMAELEVVLVAVMALVLVD